MRVYDMCNDFEEVKGSFRIGDSSYWVVINFKELDILKRIIYLDKESLEDCLNEDQSSKISFFSEYIFLVLNILDFKYSTLYAEELNIFLSKDYIVTVYKQEGNLVEEFLEDLKREKNCFLLKQTPKPSILFYYLLDRIIIKNYNVISSLEADIDKVEIRILKNPQKEQLNSLINLRRQVYKIKKYLNPLRYIGDSLITNENSIIEKNNIPQFRTLNDKIDKLMMALEGLTQDLAMVREAFEAEIANKTNELMKIFTVIATIFLPLNLFASMLGMNVRHIPLSCIDYGYYYALGIMIFITILLIYIFKRKNWI